MPETGCGVYKTGLTAARWCDTICSALRCSSAASSLVEREPPPCTQKRTQTTAQRQTSLAPRVPFSCKQANEQSVSARVCGVICNECDAYHQLRRDVLRDGFREQRDTDRVHNLAHNRGCKAATRGDRVQRRRV